MTVEINFVKEAIEKCRDLSTPYWEGPHSLEPYLDALNSLLQKSFNLSEEGGIYETTLILEEKRILSLGTSDLAAELEFEIEDSYSDEDSFTSEYIVAFSERVQTGCQKALCQKA